MIDFHSHIIPNIDDGSSSLEESINLIKEAEKAGFTAIISTSHYIEGYYDYNQEERKKYLENLYNAENNDKNVKLYLGSEIYITEDMFELIEQEKASTINNSRYILFELPMNSKTFLAKEIVYRAIEKGYLPIIAHPERYTYVQEDINYARELSNMGALFQSNYGSIIGMYGNHAKKTIYKLLEDNLIQFLGSDVHREGPIYNKVPKILKKLEKVISKKKIEELTQINAEKVLNNENIL